MFRFRALSRLYGSIEIYFPKCWKRGPAIIFAEFLFSGDAEPHSNRVHTASFEPVIGFHCGVVYLSTGGLDAGDRPLDEVKRQEYIMLPRLFRLAKNASNNKWELISEPDGRVLKTYRTMKMALSRREIERAIDNTGQVTIHHRDGRVETLHYPTRTRR